MLLVFGVFLVSIVFPVSLVFTVFLGSIVVPVSLCSQCFWCL